MQEPNESEKLQLVTKVYYLLDSSFSFRGDILDIMLNQIVFIGTQLFV